MASICSVTFMDPSSAPIPAATRPLTTKPVITGPVSFSSENTITAGSMDFAPNRVKLSRVCRAKTTPVAAPANATKTNDREPISSNCRTNSPPSNGGTSALRASRATKSPSSPNHSNSETMLHRTSTA